MLKVFNSKPMNDWITEAKKKPIPKMLFSEFWFEGELCIMYSDTNLGKSILAIQIGDSISKAQPIEKFAMSANAQKVLYFDFENSEKNLEGRYSEEYLNHYVFDHNFVRSTLNIDCDTYLSEDTINKALQDEIITFGAKVVIIDNITFLNDNNEKAKYALNLMKFLKALKSKLDLSILILAHTPKRTFDRPISNNDLQGSKMLINFCDSAFAIGASYLDSQLRYLKQIKQRNCEQIYGTENVCLFKVNKGLSKSKLQFEFIEFDNEISHLNIATDLERDSKILEAKRLKANGMTNVAIGKELEVSEGCVRKWTA